MQFAVDVAHRQLFGESIIEDIEHNYVPDYRVQISFNEAHAIEEINSVMQIQNRKWYNTLSGNRNNAHVTFSTNLAGVCLYRTK